MRAGFLHGTVLVCSPVLAELQGLADSGDDQCRSRGRRGLEVLEALQREHGVDVEVLDLEVPGVHEVDAKLVRICLDRGTALLTLDTNLAKAAALAGVPVLNLHALALALRPPVAAGDDVPVLLLKPGKEPGQAVGYLDDGSMVVVERGRAHLGSEVRRPGHERAHHRERPAGLRPSPPTSRTSACERAGPPAARPPCPRSATGRPGPASMPSHRRTP